MRRLSILLCLVLAGCGTTVGEKVLVDFGVKEKPEDYESGSDRVFAKLPDIGAVEMRRLNLEGRHGEVKYQDDGFQGKFYKEVKVYENFHPLEARAYTQGGRHGERGYAGFIEYTYRIYQSARVSTRAEAMNQEARIGTSEEGRETYRYRFSYAGEWNGADGQLSRN